MDELLAVVADPKRYPHLRQITITGFGRGAEWVLRHATASAAPEALARLNPPLQLNWVVASPDRYTYLDSRRWDAKRMPSPIAAQASPMAAKPAAHWTTIPMATAAQCRAMSPAG
ncbi:hypothetical protein [Xanthomonas graminis]|uniref:hypothetical protein n=1 Tax=Xanthomonas graminis TaxID=3390026 RepID=UPI0011875D22|nr:hypothetical protein [Xanthomonas translucens]UKE77982.1 hypothetical protein KM317_01595 [Xanthomonas translucens pv. arrhenatheri]